MTVQIDIKREVRRLQRTQIVELEQVNLIHRWLDGQRLCRQPGRILGESRTGKSSAITTYIKENPPSQPPGLPPEVPILSFTVPQECGAKELYCLIVETLNFRVVRGTTAELRRRAFKHLQDCKVEMLIIDEADRIKPKVFADVRDIFDNLGIAVILVGTDRLDAVIGRDEQVKNRFYAQFRVGVLNPIQFEQTVLVWEQQILKLPVSSNLTAKSTLKLLREKTRGYIGLLDMILRQAAIAALLKGEHKITIDTLTTVMAGYG